MSLPNKPLQVQHIEIGPDHDGQRVDNFLLGQLKGVPKSRIYSMLRNGEVRVDGGRVKPETRLAEGQRLRLPPVRQATPTTDSEGGLSDPSQRVLAQRMADGLPVVYEADGLLVVDKPAGVAVHGGSGIRLGVVEALRAQRQDPMLELVHRLDRDTSGLLMLATSRKALLGLHQQLRDGQMRKRYLAVVLGDWKPMGTDPTRLIKAPLLKTLSANGERWVRVDPKGQPSMTRVRLLARGELPGIGPISLLQCEPLTGRTHQIRVHLQSAGHPILGDPKYGVDGMNDLARQQGLSRMYLHAWRLAIGTGEGGSQRLELAAEPTGALRRDFEAMGLTQVGAVNANGKAKAST
ncbi:MAG: RluA family pseudouridine synthase [Burkholderiaceae bacterium]